MTTEDKEQTELRGNVSELDDLLSSQWLIFLKWIADYAGDPDIAAQASYSREDMRYAYAHGFKKALDLIRLSDRPMTGDEIAEKIVTYTRR